MSLPSFGERDFTQSEEVFEYYDLVRQICGRFGLECALNSANLDAVLRETYPPGGGRWEARMRARRVSRHTSNLSEGLRTVSQGAARVQAIFKREFAAELGIAGKPDTPKKRMVF